MKTKLIIPEHLQGEYEKRIGNNGKPIEFVCRFKLEQFEPEPPSPNTFDNVMFMGKRECGRDLFTVWNNNCPAITVSYLGHLNDGYISE
jgi:hypothetical protein